VGFTRTKWRKRNKLIHQSTRTAETDGRILSLHCQVTQYYSSYSTNPDFLLPRFHDLFTRRTLSQSLQLSPDFLQCWISSVQTAIMATEIHIPHQRQIASLFFHPSVDLTDSSYHPSDQSVSSTISFTTESTNPLTDNDSSMSTCSWANPHSAISSQQSLASSPPTDTDTSATSSSTSSVSYPV
jgi:hypothetical protein